MITRPKISAVRASGVRRLLEGGAYSRTALIRVNTVVVIEVDTDIEKKST